MDMKWCNACGDAFTPDYRTPRQAYCTKECCQRERKRLWQLLKRHSDPDYLENQTRAQRKWLERNTDYWRNYREMHPEYVERNKQLQRKRRRIVAKMDASVPPPAIENGTYELRVLDIRGVASMDPIKVVLTVILPRNSS